MPLAGSIFILQVIRKITKTGKEQCNTTTTINSNFSTIWGWVEKDQCKYKME